MSGDILDHMQNMCDDYTRSFDGHTCGECAWGDVDLNKCRRCAPWETFYTDDDACPAFVPRKEKEDG